MPHKADCNSKTDLVLALFGALSEIRALENHILDAITKLTAPADILNAPHVMPAFRGQQLKGRIMQDVHSWALGTGARHDQAGDGKR